MDISLLAELIDLEGNGCYRHLAP